MDFVKVGEKDGNIILADKDGNRAVFEFLEMTVIDQTEYAALLQTDDECLVLLRFAEGANGKEVYSTIDDDALFDRVAAAFEEIFDED
ncbi:MAG: DUF1292 domain-containing protein [Clostridia bacterium]|nr:DUF1292 domain-containing protein [Clostridia bacterium]MBR3955319.1 DUF1292 domain-containing protein [Clostridia bacterium]